MNRTKDFAAAGIAAQIDTIDYEVTARIASRVPRIYRDELPDKHTA